MKKMFILLALSTCLFSASVDVKADWFSKITRHIPFTPQNKEYKALQQKKVALKKADETYKEKYQEINKLSNNYAIAAEMQNAKEELIKAYNEQGEKLLLGSKTAKLLIERLEKEVALEN